MSLNNLVYWENKIFGKMMKTEIKAERVLKVVRLK
jgi:hypothetical protein